MKNNQKDKVIQAFKNFDIVAFQVLLDDDKTYMGVTKSHFLEQIERSFAIFPNIQSL